MYRGARCVAYMSPYEGFGLPVLEAMACGAPVVAGRNEVSEEIAGSAVVLVDPLDPDAIAPGWRRRSTGPTSFAPSAWRERAPSTGAR